MLTIGYCSTGRTTSLLDCEEFVSPKVKGYKITEKIGSGGFGYVYKGIRLKDNFAVAVKVINKQKIDNWTVVRKNSGFDFLIEI